MKKKLIHLIILGIVLTPLNMPALNLGMSAVFSGPTKALGVNFYNGSNAYFTYINEKGGINGELIHIITKDDTYNPVPCIQNTIELIEDNDILILFNYVGTPTTVAMLPLLKIYEDTGIVLFGNFTGAGAQRTNPYVDFVFSIRASYKQETNALVNHFLENGYSRIGIYYQIDGYGRSGYVGVAEALENHGRSIAGEATYVRGSNFSTDMTLQAEHLKESGVDAVISVGAYAPCSAFIRDARKVGFQGPIANISFVGTEALIDLLFQNTVPTENLYFSEVVPNYNDVSIPLVREYQSVMKSQGQEMNFGSFEGFINAKIFVEILKQVDIRDVRREKMRGLIESMSPIDIGLEELLFFSPQQHQIFNDVYIYKLKSSGDLEAK